MTRRPDFTDIFNARAKMRDAVAQGHRLLDAGDRKGARLAYKDALKWEKEMHRLEAEKHRGRASPTPRKAPPARGGTSVRPQTTERRKFPRSSLKPSRR